MGSQGVRICDSALAVLVPVCDAYRRRLLRFVGRACKVVRVVMTHAYASSPSAVSAAVVTAAGHAYANVTLPRSRPQAPETVTDSQHCFDVPAAFAGCISKRGCGAPERGTRSCRVCWCVAMATPAPCTLARSLERAARASMLHSRDIHSWHARRALDPAGSASGRGARRRRRAPGRGADALAAISAGACATCLREPRARDALQLASSRAPEAPASSERERRVQLRGLDHAAVVASARWRGQSPPTSTTMAAPHSRRRSRSSARSQGGRGAGCTVSAARATARPSL